MSARLSRKDMKRDDFANAVERSVEYAESHTRMILYAIGAVLVLAALVFGIRAFLDQRSAAASADLSYAIKVYEAPIVAPGANTAGAAKSQDKVQPSFADEASRRSRAKQLFEGVRAKHGSTDAADVAGLYLAQMAATAGKLDEARKLWSEFADRHKDSAPAAEARLNLYDIDRRQGKGEELVRQLHPMLDDSSSPLPKDVVLYQLGLTYDQLQRKQEAIGVFQQIVDEFPQSPYRQEAQQKLAALDPNRVPQNALGALGGPGGLPPGL
ncbi:MAG TPA: tetratricopeptide repeat protein [Thermoanaerobaculia bacterium]|jgi:tetratricopeptide (TPR) repeat protein|nr:tetratricopeptide repeat protein [Thermoanaerobaculia bacterium]